MIPSKFSVLLVAFVVIGLQSKSQDRCGTVEVRAAKKERFLLRETDEIFEDWLHQKKAQVTSHGRAGVYTIPVVVHVIHRGEALGTGTNISDAQIESQIAVLNKDFTRKNADAANTPAEFKSVAGALSIEFVLASSDPNGARTNGIVRVKGSKATWSTENESLLKATSYWPAEDYLNIWVADLPSGLLGYAQFPVSDLKGLENAIDNRLTDGVVIDYSVFGSNDYGDFDLIEEFSKGRTATHEVGHFLGLRHIWGDDNGACTGNGDYVDDTPNQGNSTTGCPSHPQSSCDAHTMFQNYMDYSNDQCLNLFTAGQVERMIAVLENSPRRASLLSSPGADSENKNDVAVTFFGKTSASNCQQTISTSLKFVNNGTEDISKAMFEIKVNNVIYTRKKYEGHLAQGDTVILLLNNLELAEGANKISVDVGSVNGGVDENPRNNKAEFSVYAPHSVSLPYKQSFDVMPDDWHESSEDGSATWSLASSGNEVQNMALSLPFLHSPQSDLSNAMFSPMFNLAGKKGYLIFDVWYVANSSSQDGLEVFLARNCNEYSLGTATRLWKKSGRELATAQIAELTSPSSLAEWRREVIDLSAFKNLENVRIAFRGLNDGGNNIYIDNLSIVQNVNEDVGIVKVVKPTPVKCQSTVSPLVTVKNYSKNVVSQIKLKYWLNSASPVIEVVKGIELASGDSVDITLPSLDLKAGINSLSFKLLDPNDLFDQNPANDSVFTQTVVNNDNDIIPLRQNFDEAFDSWTSVNPRGLRTWQVAKTDYDQSMHIAATGEVVGSAWLATPLLDLSSASAGGMFFEVAAVADSSGTNVSVDTSGEKLMILASLNCGESYDSVLFNEEASSFLQGLDDQTSKSLSWQKKFVSLSRFAGMSDVRIAFVYTGGRHISTYLDNIEFFVSDDDSPLEVQEPFAIYGTDPSSPDDFIITFDLPQRKDITCSLLDMSGRTVQTMQFANVLNQTYTIEPHVNAGMYLVRLQIDSQLYIKRIFLN